MTNKLIRQVSALAWAFKQIAFTLKRRAIPTRRRAGSGRPTAAKVAAKPNQMRCRALLSQSLPS